MSKIINICFVVLIVVIGIFALNVSANEDGFIATKNRDESYSVDVREHYSENLPGEHTRLDIDTHASYSHDDIRYQYVPNYQYNQYNPYRRVY